MRRRISVWIPIVLGLALGALYEGAVLLGSGGLPLRIPIPYAVPIFDTPFALVAAGVGYLCLERHRLRQDVRSAGMGSTLWLTALLALAHIAAQPDYPANPGVNAGIAPYFFFLSYLAGLAGIGLAAHSGERSLPLRDRGRFAIGAGVVALSAIVVVVVLEVRPLLPSMVRMPGRFTPFGLWSGIFVIATAGAWALWGGLRRYFARDPFGGYLLLAAYIWMLGLIGVLICPYRYSIPWYLSGFARPLGVGVIFVGLLREQVWLYREARARQRDLDVLHRAGQALVRSLDLAEIARTIVTEALAVSGADGAILFRFDEPERLLVTMSHAGVISDRLASGLQMPLGRGASGVAVAERRPVVTSLLEEDPAVPFPPAVIAAMRGEGLESVVAIPRSGQTGEVYGALSVFHRRRREPTAADIDLLAAFGTQASVAIENGRSFDRLALKARHDEQLHAFSQRLLEAGSEPAIREDAVRLTRELLGADCVGLFLFDAGAGCLRMDTGVGWKPGTVSKLTITPSADSFAGYTFLHKAPILVEDLATERRFTVPSHLIANDVHAGAVMPLGIRDQPVGVLAAYYRARHRFGDEELRVLTSIAHQTALALEKVRLYTELQANLRELQETQAQLIQADKLKALGTLLSGMAHELNGPLSTIMLSAQLLQRQPALPRVVRERVDAIDEECERAARIVRELLVFARRQAPERRQSDLNEVVRAALKLQAREFELAGIRVVTALEALPRIWADAHQLQQVLLNLFTNATHAIKSAGRRGVLTVRSAEGPHGITLVVEDNGPGIPPEHLGRVFDPFFTTKGVGEGTGLGLSLSIGIVEAHGGRMSVENIPSLGARFTIRLPFGHRADVDEAPAALPAVAATGRILVVEDEAALRRVLADGLASLGHRVMEADTGQAAIDLLERETYDVVVLDLMLPGIDGKGVWQWIHGHQPSRADRVVFMTGDIGPASQRFVEDSGRPVLNKPLAMDRLGQVVAEVLAGPGDRVAVGIVQHVNGNHPNGSHPHAQGETA